MGGTALGVARRYLVAEVPDVPLRDGCADLVYTGKAAPIWMRDITAWSYGVARLLRPGARSSGSGRSGRSSPRW
jgi:hypothetical protein